MPLNIGRLIPQEDSDERLCYQLEIPNTPGWRREFFTLVLSLSRGRYWKREPTGKLITDAQQIGLEIFDSIKLCEEQPDEHPPFQTPDTIIIQEVKDMNNNCCCCNGVSLNTTSDDAHLPSEPQEPTPQPDTTTPIDGMYDDYKCQAANYFVSVLMPEVINGMASMADIADLNYEDVQGMYESTIGEMLGERWETIWVWFQSVAFWILQIISSPIAANLITWTENNSSALVDAIYCSVDATDAAMRFNAVIYDSGQINLLQKNALHILFQGTPFQMFYQDALTRMAAPRYPQIILQPTGCACVPDPSEINLPEGYIEIGMFAGTITPVNGAIIEVMQNSWMFTGQGNAGADIIVLEPIYNSMVVPNVNRVGFVFRCTFSDITNPAAGHFGHNVTVASASMSNVNFGAALNNFLTGDVFAGAIAADATMQTWIATETFKHEDNVATTDAGDVLVRFLIGQGGTTGSGDFNTGIIVATWIIDTTGL